MLVTPKVCQVNSVIPPSWSTEVDLTRLPVTIPMPEGRLATSAGVSATAATISDVIVYLQKSYGTGQPRQGAPLLAGQQRGRCPYPTRRGSVTR
jgi:hypothetical protein